MKYLNHKDNYLQKRSQIRERQQEELFYKSLEKIYETSPNSGPLGNEINWGDSLLGRLINSTLRKVQENANALRIDIQGRRLKNHFNYIMQTSIEEISNEDSGVGSKISKMKIATLLRALTQAVDEGYKVGDIKDICDDTIFEIDGIQVDKETQDVKEELLDKLEEFRKWLDQFKDDEGGKSREDELKEEGDDEEEQSGVKTGSDEKPIYATMIKSLKSLALILAYYKKVTINAQNLSSKKHTYTTKQDDTLTKIASDLKINKFKLKEKDILTKNQIVTHKGEKKKFGEFFQPGKDKNTQPLPSEILLVMEDFMFFFENALSGSNKEGSKTPIGSGGGQERANIKVGEDFLSQAFAKLKKSCEFLESKDKDISVTTDFLNAITSQVVGKDKKVADRAKRVIFSLFFEINRFLVGDKKTTLNAAQDPLYKESLEALDNTGTTLNVAQKIAIFTKRAMQFDGENLYGGLGDLGNPLKEYVESMKVITKSEIKKIEVKKEENKEPNKNERVLLKYDSFLRKINEAEEGEEGTEGETKNSVSDQIREYYRKNFDIAYWAISQDDVDEVEEKVKNYKKDNEGRIVIQGIGPIIEIFRIFNRAYKIHTKNAIPFSGRTEGKLNAITMNQWTAFGNTSGEMAGKGDGPYRNNRLFNKWENYVFDVFKEYEEVFDKGTSIRNGDRVKDNAGAILRQMILDLLDGEELYKSSDSGSTAGTQKKYLNKYFGEVTDDVDIKDESVSDKDPKTGNPDTEDIGPIADAIEELKYVFVRREEVKEDLNSGKFDGMSFQVKATNEKGEDVRFYFNIQDFQKDFYYLTYSRTFYYHNAYLKSQVKGGSPTVSREDSIKNGAQVKLEKESFGIFGTKIKKQDLIDFILKRKEKFEINAIDSKGKSDERGKTISVKDIHFLSKQGGEKGKEKYTLYKNTDMAKLRVSIDQTSGFKNILDSLKSDENISKSK
jgi:predicted CopG family antitoxin